MQGFPRHEKPTRGLEPRTPSLRVMAITPTNPCTVSFDCVPGGLEPAVNTLCTPSVEPRRRTGRASAAPDRFVRDCAPTTDATGHEAGKTHDARRGGQVVSAIGTSGETADEDEAISLAGGAAAFRPSRFRRSPTRTPPRRRGGRRRRDRARRRGHPSRGHRAKHAPARAGPRRRQDLRRLLVLGSPVGVPALARPPGPLPPATTTRRRPRRRPLGGRAGRRRLGRGVTNGCGWVGQPPPTRTDRRATRRPP